MKIMVAGITGYIGGTVARALKANGYYVRGLARDPAKLKVPEQADEVFKGEATRARIVEAAYRLFIEQGFHATSMDDIIRAAGTSPGGLYRYFPGKEAIITAGIIVYLQRANPSLLQTTAILANDQASER